MSASLKADDNKIQELTAEVHGVRKGNYPETSGVRSPAGLENHLDNGGEPADNDGRNPQHLRYNTKKISLLQTITQSSIILIN